MSKFWYLREIGSLDIPLHEKENRLHYGIAKYPEYELNQNQHATALLFSASFVLKPSTPGATNGFGARRGKQLLATEDEVRWCGDTDACQTECRSKTELKTWWFPKRGGTFLGSLF